MVRICRGESEKRAALRWGIGTVLLAAIGGLSFYMHQHHAPDLVAQAFWDGMQAEKRGDLSEAASKYKQTVVLDPTFCSGYFNLGDVNERQTKSTEALNSFERALSCFTSESPQSPRVYSETTLKLDIDRTAKRIEKLKSGVHRPTS